MTRPSDCDVLIIGGGPCGLAAAISAQRAGLKAIVVEARVICSTIAAYPTYVSFFSTAEKLSLGGVPFVVSADKPTRRDGLAYYRAVTRHFRIDVRQYERVTAIDEIQQHVQPSLAALQHERLAESMQRVRRQAFRPQARATGRCGWAHCANSGRSPTPNCSSTWHAMREPMTTALSR